MNWYFAIPLIIIISFLLIQFFLIQKIKSKKGKYLHNIDGELGKLLSMNKKMMIYFWTESCSICKRQTPIVKELSSEFQNVFLFNLSEQINLASKLGIMAVPTILFISNYKIDDVLVGYQDKDKLRQMLIKFNG